MGHPVADGSHAFVRVAVHSLIVPRGTPRLDAWRRRRSERVNQKEAGTQSGQARTAQAGGWRASARGGHPALAARPPAKPCTCKHRPPHGEAANGSLDRLQFIRSYTVTWITVVILELIHATSAPTCLAGRGEFIRSKPTGPRGPNPLVTQDNFGLIARPWRRRRIFQVSALSSSVCRCPAYIAGDG